jgi:hypothetical protein
MNFLKYYDVNIQKINEYIKNNSGIHNINNDKSREWVEKQPNNIYIRRACELILKHTKYVTLEDVKTNIFKLINIEYRKIIQENKNRKKICMFVDKKYKSNHFLSIIALHAIKEYNLEEPSIYYDEIPKTIPKCCKDAILIYVDDMAYSGGQIIYFLNKIINVLIIDTIKNTIQTTKNISLNNLSVNNNDYETIIREMKNKISNFSMWNTILLYDTIINKINSIHFFSVKFLLLGVNNTSLERLRNYSIPNTFKESINNFFSNTLFTFEKNIKFKIDKEILFAEKFKTLDQLCNSFEIFLISYYFSFGRVPNILLYYDHKIADFSSTYLRVLNYGLIVPVNFNIKNYWPSFTSILTSEGYKNAQRSDWFNSPISSRYFELCHMYYNHVNTNEIQDINATTMFCPFINNLNRVNQIINNNIIHKINYLMLISEIPSNKQLNMPCISVNINTFEFTHISKSIPYFEITDLIHIKFKNDKVKYNIFKFLLEVDNNSCELSFYKIRGFILG